MDEEQTNGVVESAETATQVDNQEDYESNDSTGESEGAAQSESGEQRTTETPEQRQARIKRQVEREAKKQGLSVEEFLGTKTSKEGEQKGSQEEVDERYHRLDLKTEGITNKKEQDIILDYAKYKGIEPTEAMKSPAIKAELAELRAKNVPAPSTRTSGGSNDSYDYYVKNIKAGKIRLADVPDAAMRKKLMSGKIFG